jgi:TRAP-type C4-dicarboxylate transport system substrate-binding protein
MQRAVKDAVTFQRNLAIKEDRDAKKTILDQGCEITELKASEQRQFVAAVKPLRDEAQQTYGEALFSLLAAA